MTPERLTEVEQAARRLRVASPTGEDPVADHLEECIDEVRRLQTYNDRNVELLNRADAAFEDCNQRLQSHLQTDHEDEYLELVEVLKREEVLKDKIQSLEAALEATGNAMDVLGIKEKDAEIERLKQVIQIAGILAAGGEQHGSDER